MLCVESQHYLAARTLRNYPVKLGEQSRQNWEVTAVAPRAYAAGELSSAVLLYQNFEKYWNSEKFIESYVVFWW